MMYQFGLLVLSTDQVCKIPWDLKFYRPTSPASLNPFQEDRAANELA